MLRILLIDRLDDWVTDLLCIGWNFVATGGLRVLVVGVIGAPVKLATGRFVGRPVDTWSG